MQGLLSQYSSLSARVAQAVSPADFDAQVNSKLMTVNGDIRNLTSKALESFQLVEEKLGVLEQSMI